VLNFVLVLVGILAVISDIPLICDDFINIEIRQASRHWGNNVVGEYVVGSLPKL
jgi:hypothetical protein